MTEASPDLQELIRRAIDARLRNVNVAMPGIVVDYNAAKKTATVQPALRSTVPDDEGFFQPEDLPPLQNVKVIWPKCGKLSITGTLQAGDSVELVFQTRATTEWRRTGKVSTPVDERYHGLGYPVAYPGLDDDTADDPDTDESIGIPGGQRIHFTPSAIKAGTGSVAVANAVKVDLLFNAIKAAGAAGTSAGPVDPGAAAFLTALNTALATVATATSNLKADP